MTGNATQARPFGRVNAATRSWQTYFVSFALFLLCGWLLFNSYTTVERIVHSYTALPYWDYWRVAQDLSAFETFDLHAFWRQHNDHRIIFPEIVFALDMLYMHGRLILPLALSFLSYVATWLVASSTIFADRGVGRPLAIAASLLAGVIAFWEGSTALLATPFQLQWTFMQLASVCALLWLSRLKDTLNGKYLAGVIAAGVVANYSSGNGLLIWPLLLGIGFLLKLRRSHWIALAIASVTSIGLYFVQYQFGSDLQLRSLLMHPQYLVGYFGSYLSMPFGGMNSPAFGVNVGLGQLVFTIFFFVLAFRRGLLCTKPAVVLFGSYAFTLLTILITAAGRMDPTDPSFGAAKPSRYITVPLMNWAVFILLSLWISARAQLKLFSPPVLAALMSLLLLLYLPKLRDWLALITEDYAEQQLGALSLENDIVDPNLIRKIFISPEFVVNYLPELRDRHLSIYYKSREERWFGKPVEQFSHKLNTVFPGELSHTYPVRGGVEVLGWADGSSLRRAYRWLVLTNERGQIAGFGQQLAAGFPAALRSDNTPPSLAWVGFVNLTIPASSISAYVVDPRRGGLYPIAGSIPVPTVQLASLEETAGPIPGVTWQKDSIWTENNLPPRVPYGEMPPGVSYGSWSNNDANQGQLVSSAFAKPANSCVVLPVVHGPKTQGLSVDLVDADTGQPIATAPMQDWAERWEYWRVPISASVQHLRIKAQDGGKDWGEWVATANPLDCL